MMKQLKMIRLMSIMTIILFILFIISHAFLCMRLNYSHPELGIASFKWQDQFLTDLQFILIIFAVPLIFVIATFIVSCLKIRKLKVSNQVSKPKKEKEAAKEVEKNEEKEAEKKEERKEE